MPSSAHRDEQQESEAALGGEATTWGECRRGAQKGSHFVPGSVTHPQGTVLPDG